MLDVDIKDKEESIKKLTYDSWVCVLLLFISYLFLA